MLSVVSKSVPRPLGFEKGGFFPACRACSLIWFQNSPICWRSSSVRASVKSVFSIWISVVRVLGTESL